MTPPYGRKRIGTKEPLDGSERAEWKSWLKAQHSENEDHGIWSYHSWEIDGETVETVSDFILGGSQITADGDCSHEIKRRLLLGRKVMTNLDSIFKSRHYFANKGPSSQGYGFSCGHVGCESWTVRKAECQRIDAFELWCWRRLLRVSWPARRSNSPFWRRSALGFLWKEWC